MVLLLFRVLIRVLIRVLVRYRSTNFGGLTCFSSVDPRVLTPSLWGVIPRDKLKPGRNRVKSSGLEADLFDLQAGICIEGAVGGGSAGADHEAAQ